MFSMTGEQAKRLYKAGAGRMGTDDDVFIEILTKESRAQIQVRTSASTT
jgi:Annexin